MTPQLIVPITQILSWIGAITLALVVAYLIHRKGLDLVTQRAVQEWKTLAEAYEGQVAHLQGELDDLHKTNGVLLEQNSTLREQNSSLIQLNLTLQNLNQQHLAKIEQLEGRVRILELGARK